MKAKITVRDINGRIWEKEGDLAMGAVATVKHGGINGTEIDFSSMSPKDLVYFLATALLIASEANEQFAEEAIRLYQEKKKLT